MTRRSTLLSLTPEGEDCVARGNAVLDALAAELAPRMSRLPEEYADRIAELLRALRAASEARGGSR